MYHASLKKQITIYHFTRLELQLFKLKPAAYKVKGRHLWPFFHIIIPSCTFQQRASSSKQSQSCHHFGEGFGIVQPYS